ncbi:hypothetical protein Bca4012_023692 [Brassica carinata]
MDVLMKHNLLNSFIIALILTLVFLISPSSSSTSSNQETRVSPQKTETYLNGDESPHQLVYIKKHILNPRQRDQHRRLRYNHQYFYYRHSIRRRGLRPRANYFKMMTKKSSNGFNRPVQPDTYSAMLPKGFVPPSGSSPCHNQNPNSATTLFCDLSTQP